VSASDPAPPAQPDPAARPVAGTQRVLVVMPTWFGDCLMATPTLRALRAAFPDAHLEALIREPLAPLLDGLPFLDGVVVHGGGAKRSGRGRSSGGGRGSSPLGLAKRLNRMKFDVAVLLPNSFRSAALVAMAGIKRRVGYDRDGRAMLLTDRLVPRHDGKDYVPVPAVEYYLSIAAYLGAPVTDHRMEVHDRLGLAVAVTGAPDEREIVARVAGAAPCRVIDLLKAGATLGQLKSVVKQSRVVVTNDTGPRHLAAALGTPVVTLFGPTLPAWTEIGFAHERQLRAADPAAADAMRQINVGSVFKATADLVQATEPSAASGP